MDEEQRPSFFFKIKRFAIECKRVLKVTKKPDKLEFGVIVKVSGLGMVIIGLIGFIVQMIKILLL